MFLFKCTYSSILLLKDQFCIFMHMLTIFIHSIIHSFIHSFLHSFIQSSIIYFYKDNLSWLSSEGFQHSNLPSCSVSPLVAERGSSNPAHGEVYSIHHYVIKFVSDLRQVSGFFRVLRFPSQIKLTVRYNWNIIKSGVKHHNPTANIR